MFRSGSDIFCPKSKKLNYLQVFPEIFISTISADNLDFNFDSMPQKTLENKNEIRFVSDKVLLNTLILMLTVEFSEHRQNVLIRIWKKFPKITRNLTRLEKLTMGNFPQSVPFES